ncbi:hypothetical protein [Flavobacterium sp. KACC 22763]|uniref:hypothetical protein n=1 Tax=Flavobacterium sp. KACC 22763 TaxID=3025668 RepID=UPI002366B3E4|nr:hypothetical protein [Flavobacterium sp. KACC 22763]WDF64548.1 hypothetical protein PQ463_00040 [Flavobacterium sp. KACC 22763]
MANELKITEEKNFNTLKFNLGSLYSKLRSSGLPNLDKKGLKTLFIAKKEELNQFHTSFGSIQSSKIWTRIKSCSSEFSKENECQLLMGSVNKTKNLFTAKNIDVKSNLITYNQKV